MLVLTRGLQQGIVVGENVVVSIVQIGNGRVRLAIEAPAEVAVRRSELPARSAEGLEWQAAGPAADR